MKKLHRSTSDDMLCGVCAGLAEMFGTDPTIVRLAYAFLTLVTGVLPGVLTYVLACFIVPAQGQRSPAVRRIHRSRDDRMIAGVIGGLAEALEVDASLLRLIVVFVCLATVILPGVVIYLLAWAIIPVRPSAQRAGDRAAAPH